METQTEFDNLLNSPDDEIPSPVLPLAPKPPKPDEADESYCAQCETGYCEKHMGAQRREEMKNVRPTKKK